ncbi:MAG: tetratricopeptide repeat protein [Oscillospiraceae bacterium]|nr:tetratricopeptide repeat protein [Oscillospiraceae bacterium]
MIIALSALCVVSGLLGLTAFDGTAATAVALCTVGTLCLAARLILRKAFKDRRVALAAFAALTVAFLALSGLTGTMERDLAKTAAAFSEVDGLLGSGRAEEALERLVELRKDGGHQDDNTEICLREFKAYRLMSNDYKALQSLERCAKFKDVRYFMAFASAQLAEGKQREALDTYMEAAALYPLYHEAQLKAGYLCFVRGEYTRAAHYLLRACEIDPQDPHSLFFLGSVRYAQGRYPEAEGYLLRVLETSADGTVKGDARSMLDSMPERGD